MAKSNSLQRTPQMINWVEESAPPQLISPQQRSSSSPKLDTILEEDNNGNNKLKAAIAEKKTLTHRSMISRTQV